MPDEVKIRVSADGVSKTQSDLAGLAGAIRSTGEASAEAAGGLGQLRGGAAELDAESASLIGYLRQLADNFLEMGARAVESGAEIREGMAEASESVAQFTERAELARGQVSLLGAAGAALGGGALIAGMGMFIEHIEHSVLETRNLASEAGMSVEKLTMLEDALKEIGVATEGTAASILFFSRAVEASRDGEQKQQAALGQLHITTADFGKALEEAAEHLAHSSATLRDNAAMREVFGRGIAHVIGQLRAEGGELEQNTQKYKEHADQVARSVKAAAELEYTEARLSAALQTAVLPALVAIADAVLGVEFGFERAAVRMAYWGDEVITRFRGFQEMLRAAVTGNFAAMEAAHRAAAESVARIEEEKLARIREIDARQREEEHKLYSKPEPPALPSGGSLFGPPKELVKAQHAAQEEAVKGAEEHAARMLDIEREKWKDLAGLTFDAAAIQFANNARINAAERDARWASIAQREALAKNDPDAPKKLQELANERWKVLDDYEKRAYENQQRWAEERHKIRENDLKIAEGLDALALRQQKEFAEQTRALLDLGLGDKNAAAEKEAADRLHARLVEEASQAEHNLRVAKLEQDLAIARMRFLGMPEAMIAKQMAEDARVIGELQAKVDALKAQMAGLPTGAATRQAEGRSKALEDADATTAKVKSAMAQIHSFGEGVKATFDASVQHMGASLTNALTSWIEGTERFGTAMSKMARQMAVDFIRSLVEMALQKFVIDKLFHASTATTAVAGVTSQAALAGAETTAYYAAINPPLAIPAGVAMMSASLGLFGPIASAERGGIMPGHPTLALLHPREMVLPSNVTSHILNSFGGASNVHQRGGDQHIHVTVNNASGMDAKDLVKRLGREMRRQNKSHLHDLNTGLATFGY
jgi:hypothetical protein